MANFKFHDYSIEVKEAMDKAIFAALEEGAAEIESAAKKNSRVDTGQTKNSFQHKVVESEKAAYIGSNYENAIWEEFGTGEYALKGNGRKGGWVYVDDKGKGHFTHGKKPSRAFYKAYESNKGAVKTILENALKGL